MLMTRIGITNNGCDVVHLVAGNFNLHVDGFTSVSSEMRSAEYAANILKLEASHPFVAISDLDDEYENGTVELSGDGPIKYGSTETIAAYTPDEAEPVWDMDESILYVGDGETPGGIPINAPSEWDVEQAAGWWDDLRVPTNATKLGGSKDPGFEVFRKDLAGTSQGVFIFWFNSSAEEELYFCAQMPHGWNGTSIIPHVHWVPKTTADGTPAAQKVKWALEYTWSEIGAVFPVTTIISAYTPFPGTDANLVANKHYMTILPTIPSSASVDGLSSMLICRVFRDATDAVNDTYEHDAGLLEIDFHYQMDRPGSREELQY